MATVEGEFSTTGLLARLHPSQDPPRFRLPAAAAVSFGAGLIHLWYASPHFGEWVGYGLFFLGVGVAQVGFAAGILLRPKRPLFILGAAGNALVIGTYLLSRTTGVPVGPHAWTPEPVTFPDLAATTGEMALVVWLIALARDAAPIGPPLRRPVLLPALVAVVVLAGAAAPHPSAHDHHAHDHTHSHPHRPALPDRTHVLDLDHEMLPDHGAGHMAEFRRARAEGCIDASDEVEPLGAPSGPRVVSNAWPDLYLFDVSSGTDTRLTFDGDACRFVRVPRFRSPMLLTYLRSEEVEHRYQNVLWQLDLTTGVRTELLRAGEIATYAWEPTGRRVAYVGWDAWDERGFGTDVRVLDAETGVETTLRSLPEGVGSGCGWSGDDRWLDWSADGTHLLIVDTAFHGDRTLRVLGPDGADAIEPRPGSFGRWLDATTIIFRDREQGGAWFRLDVTQDRARRLDARADTYHLAVAPDGTRIAYDDAAGRLWIYDLATGRQRRIAGTLARASWLDERTLIAMRIEPCEDCHGPWHDAGSSVIVDVDTGEQREVAIPSLWDTTVSPWTTDEAPTEPLDAPEPDPSHAPDNDEAGPDDDEAEASRDPLARVLGSGWGRLVHVGLP